MPRARSARRYAQAAFSIARERGELDAWMDDLHTLARLLESRELSELLDAPQVPASRKLEMVRQVLGDSVSPLAVNLLALLASRSAAHLAPAIVDQYSALLDAHRGVERAEVVSAIDLSSEQRDRIAAVLAGLVDKQVRLSSRTDPGIIGGLVARVGDRVIDGSTRGRLNGLRRSLVEQKA